MNLPDRTYRALKRLQVLTGVAPVGLFLLSHFAINARAMAGPEAYRATTDAIARVPALPLVEAVAIALPIAAHLALGILLGTTRQASREIPHPSVGWRYLHRATGLYLTVYVVFHVWAIRLSPDRLHHAKPLFELMAAQLRHPVIFALQSIAVLAAATHFAGGLVALGGPGGFALSPALRRPLGGVAIASFVLLAALGFGALLAFVWPPARWIR